MHAQYRLLKRQDLLCLGLNLFYPRTDKMIYRFELDTNEMDNFILAFGQRKSLVKLAKDYSDLVCVYSVAFDKACMLLILQSSFATERRNVTQFGLPATYAVFAEISESVTTLIDQATQQFIKRYERYIDYMHFSDQYCGQRTEYGFYMFYMYK